jgi:TDG/mug DNA glycosylase family protein
MILPDVLAPGLAVVFCGTAPGRVSALRRAYYAGPGNYFWPALHRAGLTPRRLAPAEYAGVVAFGVGLTDLNKTEFGQDVDLSPNGWDLSGLLARVGAVAPARVAFTSKTAAAVCAGVPTGALVYGAQSWRIAGAEAWVLPSPSGQARRYWDEGPWRALGAAVRSTPGEPVAPGAALR